MGVAPTLSSRDGLRRLKLVPAVPTKGTYRWVFESPKGHLEGELRPAGLSFGAVAVDIVHGPVLRPGVYDVVLRTSDGVEQADLVITGGECLDAGSFLPEVLDTNGFLASFARWAEPNKVSCWRS